MCQETKHIRIAILSDQHFHEPKPDTGTKSHSHISINTLGLRPGKNPWPDLEDLVKREEIKADLLLCAGDITTHAQDSSLQVAWNCLQDLGKSLEADLIACATGNHDIRSREAPMPSRGSLLREIDKTTGVFEDLKRLSPPYPMQILPSTIDRMFGRRMRTEYFGNDFALHIFDGIRLVVVNTCAVHTSDPLTYERGMLSQSALDELKLRLDENGGSEPMINIALCHHHPEVHSDNATGTYDFLLNGEKLIQLLELYGEWLIIHGHKHDPRIVGAQGASSCPITIFSAGSLGAVLHEGMLGGEARNHFYTLDLSFNEKEGLRGTLKVWAWHAGLGWSESTPSGHKISSGSGFGERRKPRILAQTIAPMVNEFGSITWSEVIDQTDFAKYLFPRDVKLLLSELERNHKIAAHTDPSTSALILGLK